MHGLSSGSPVNEQSAASQPLLDTLRESEECFRSAFEHAAIGMALVAPDGRWMRVNRSLCEILGYSEQELLATDFQSLTHPQDLNLDLEYVRRLIAGEIRAYQMTKRYFHRDGRVVWVMLSVSLIRDVRQQPLYFISQIQDISESKATEAALLHSEAKFRQVVNQAADGLFVHDRRGRIVDANPQGCRSLGYTHEELINLNVFDIEVGCTPEALTESWRSLQPGDTRTITGLHRRRNGSTFPVEVRVGLLQVGGSELIVALVRDVTDRLMAEAVERDRLEVLELIAKGCSIEDGTMRLATMIEHRMAGSAAAFLTLRDGEINLIGPNVPMPLRDAIVAKPLTVCTQLCGNGESDCRVMRHDLRTRSNQEPFRAAAVACGLTGCWAFRIEGTDGVPLGVFALFTREPASPLAWEQRLCDTITNLAALALERHQLSDNLTRRAFYDPLTGCCNRALFSDRLLMALDRASRPDEGGALLLVDLDDFKLVNDALGHDAGDELLQQFATRIRNTLGDQHTLARLGGDEFAVLLPGVRTREDAAAVAGEIARTIRPAFSLQSGPASVTASIGGCLYPSDGAQADLLMKAADRALYRVKQAGRNGIDLIAA